jgi:hypothetical protein
VAQCLSSLSLVLARSWFDPLEKLRFVARCLRDRPPRCPGLSARYRLPSDRPRVGYGHFLFQGVVLVVWEVFRDRLPWSRGPSA